MSNLLGTRTAYVCAPKAVRGVYISSLGSQHIKGVKFEILMPRGGRALMKIIDHAPQNRPACRRV
jgi:hypothetical protein